MKKKDLLKEIEYLKFSNEILARGFQGKDSNTKKSKSKTKNWLTEQEYAGYGSKLLLTNLRDHYRDHLTVFLPSISLDNGYLTINEVDREKMVRTYCEVYNLVDNVRLILYIDDVLYNIIKYDNKLYSSLEVIVEGDIRYLILRYARGGSYSKKLAPSVRRVDNMF